MSLHIKGQKRLAMVASTSFFILKKCICCFEGNSSAVYEVENTQWHTHHALKAMTKIRPKSFFENEVKIMQQVMGHPNVVQIENAFEDEGHFNIVMEHIPGPDLTRFITSYPFSERHAAFYTRQILEAVAFCHSRNIAHRDLKPDNFKVIAAPRRYQTDPEPAGVAPITLKLIDFGSAVDTTSAAEAVTRAGTLHFTAPEILSRPIRRLFQGSKSNPDGPNIGELLKASDMWSVGVIIYLMVCGVPPFDGPTDAAVTTAVELYAKGAPLRFPSSAMSDSVRDLLQKLLARDPRSRLTASQALAHEWVVAQAEVPVGSQVRGVFIKTRQTRQTILTQNYY
jgi:calcium-dependent protein kinase